MDSAAASGEAVPMVQLNGQNTAEKTDDIKTAPASPSPSQKSLSINTKEKHSETVSINVSGDVPLVKKTVTHEESISFLNTDYNSILPDYMKNPADTTNGANGNDPANTAKKEKSSKDAPDGFNQYRNEKSFSQGLLDIALFTSNVNQLRAVTKNPPQDNEPIFNFCFIVVLLVFSIIFQVAVGLILLLSARYNVNKEDERKTVYKMGSYVVAGIFLITVFNLIIAVFYDYDNPAGAPSPNATRT